MKDKKDKIEKKRLTVVSQDLNALAEKTKNIYETVVIVSRRANQIQKEQKEEFLEKLTDVVSYLDIVDDTCVENKEQIQLSRIHESTQKPTLKSLDSYLKDEIYSTYIQAEDEDLEKNI